MLEFLLSYTLCNAPLSVRIKVYGLEIGVVKVASERLAVLFRLRLHADLTYNLPYVAAMISSSAAAIEGRRVAAADVLLLFLLRVLLLLSPLNTWLFLGLAARSNFDSLDQITTLAY